ncbi:YjdF family protein [Clostridium estertheticum]|uniref:YjdF family protein n=1 Tax=Clostridium estertheticum TaxID=238834 RepID=A0A7Y3T0G1_9CLOT|nr:YjdF family protein [Clostridium estertheticum]MBU3169938.1 YjdF family protein [Clostridium estertheticum]MBW9173640.1 YjdF family protein [Clostridium estertheticum]MCB2341074.1 YjdF family protein [Clostridium estertheticum]NNU77827.1 YjdF family protein [Clostridium estertheticum]WBL46127.1 YjdF family protein [Clostridium estertheticum]
MNVSIKLTVFFEGMFWVGVFERISAKKYEVSKVVFGSEPKDYELYDFILKEFCNLRFSNSLSIKEFKDKKINPKKLQKQIKKQTENNGIGTKAQLAMKLQQESNIVERKKNSKDENEQEKERQFAMHELKKKEKHRGH